MKNQKGNTKDEGRTSGVRPRGFGQIDSRDVGVNNGPALLVNMANFIGSFFDDEICHGRKLDGEFPSRVNNKPLKIVESIAILFLESDSDVDLPIELSESRGYISLYFITNEFSDWAQFETKLNNAFSVVDNLYLWATGLEV